MPGLLGLCAGAGTGTAVAEPLQGVSLIRTFLLLSVPHCLQQASAGLGHPVPAPARLCWCVISTEKLLQARGREERESLKTLNKLHAKSKPKQNGSGEGDK